MLPTLRGRGEMESLMDKFFNRETSPFSNFLMDDMFGSDLKKDEQGNKVLELDVPGFNENNLTINKSGNVIAVTGENGKGRKIERKMTIPVNTDDVKANVQDGVLEITFQEKEGGSDKKIPINSE